ARESAGLSPLLGAARGLKIAIRIAGVVVVVSVSVAMLQEIFDGFGRYRETESFAKSDFHVGQAHHFAPQIEQRPATVAGIDLRRGLQIQLSLHRTGLGADDAFGHGAFQSQWTA